MFGASGTGWQLDANNWTKDVKVIFESLNVITNNGPAAIGGGGTPRQPLAPPFIGTTGVGERRQETRTDAGRSENGAMVNIQGRIMQDAVRKGKMAQRYGASVVISTRSDGAGGIKRRVVATPD